MRRVEALDSRVTDNIDKTEAVISKLRSLDIKLFQGGQATRGGRGVNIQAAGPVGNGSRGGMTPDAREVVENLDMRLVSLNKKVSDIDNKLVGLKNQLDSNFLPADDINAEASEKKATSIDLSKVISAEVMQHVSDELEALRTTTANVDRKLQFHINLVSENLGKMLNMVSEVHEAVVEPVPIPMRNRTAANPTTPGPIVRPGSKLDRLARQMNPILTVSEKMDEVWDVVVGTKSSVDDLVPKSDELLTQTQRQERAISDIHADLRVKANKIIQNLDLVEKRLKKQEDVSKDIVTLAQRPVPAELLLDPTIDRLVEYDPTRYAAVNSPEDNTAETYAPLHGSSLLATTPSAPPAVASPIGSTIPYATSSSAATTAWSSATTSPTTTVGISPVYTSSSTSAGASGSSSSSTSGPATVTPRSAPRNRGVIFPSVKNKPSPANTTFTTDLLANIKDVKGYSCVDLLNAGMRDSGIYYLQIRGTTYWYLKVYCEQDVADGGWTVIQRRDDLGEPRENFNRDWTDYKNGFGDPSKEFWLGNENIYMLTNNEEYTLRVELEDFEGNKRYAQYSHFKIYSEAEYYKLEIDGYEGNAGDSLNDPWYGSNNSPFSTYNRDNDRSSLNCASMLKGGWWWKSCGRGLNGLYLNDPQDLTARQGIVWFRWRGWDYTLKRASMMIKPKATFPST
ncbi:uncharacterized protein [Hetaerina americana]|uniref:uncharacterized protein n=1 Tax=Hetaerina americana TaxID=62018 RepID=UPI003A7F5314